jgi:hypothetical protein
MSPRVSEGGLELRTPLVGLSALLGSGFLATVVVSDVVR